jgi:hypothetical protein
MIADHNLKDMDFLTIKSMKHYKYKKIQTSKRLFMHFLLQLFFK